jgi:hypothetical protein
MLYIFLRININGQTEKTVTKTDQAKKADSWILRDRTLFTISVKWNNLSTQSN